MAKTSFCKKNYLNFKSGIRFILVLSLLLPAVAYGASKKTEKKLIRMACFHYPPFMIEPSSGDKREGMIVDLLRKLFEKTDYKLKIEWMNLARAIGSVENGDMDAICSLNNKRPSKIDLIEPFIAQMKVSVWTRKTDPFVYTGVDSIGDRVVGNVHGFVYNDSSPKFQDYLNDKKNKVFVVKGSDPVKRVYQLILKNRVDMFAVNSEYTYYLLGRKYIEENFKIAGHLENKLGAYFGISPKLEHKNKVIETFRKELARINKTNTFPEIYKKYME